MYDKNLSIPFMYFKTGDFADRMFSFQIFSKKNKYDQSKLSRKMEDFDRWPNQSTKD